MKAVQAKYEFIQKIAFLEFSENILSELFEPSDTTYIDEYKYISETSKAAWFF